MSEAVFFSYELFQFPDYLFPLPCRHVLAFSALLTFLREEKPEGKKNNSFC